MDGMTESKSRRFDFRSYVVLIALIWTVIIAASWGWNIARVRRNTVDEALIQARVAYDKDIIYRRWNTIHGGVYVRVTPSTQPNPYLTVPEREVTTETGQVLTLINPAYMTRQANEVEGAQFSGRGHITSLNPLRPGNFPDEWEKAALGEFERGVREVSSVSVIDGEEHMRLMRPLVTEKGCLRCHADQGYKVGDVRGGLSVAVSMTSLRAIEQESVITLSLAHGLLWLLGLAGHLLGTRQLMRSERERVRAEKATRTYAGRLEESNRLKDLFIDIMRHDLLNPTGVIKCYAGYLLEEETDPRRRELVERIDLVNSKLTEMIQNASKYSRLEEMRSIECRTGDLNAIVREAVDLVFCQEDAKAMTLTYLPRGEHPAWVNPMIGDVFSNIASNARKYAAEGGKLEVRIDDEGAAWRVSLTDFGPGIPDEDKEKIFTRFERLNKESVKGTGLGLTIAKRLVDLHHGRIWVEDNPAGGCVFNVTVPKGPPSPAA